MGAPKGPFLFEPHGGFGGKDPDGEPWPFGYISAHVDGAGSAVLPVFEISYLGMFGGKVNRRAGTCAAPPELFSLVLKMAAAEELFAGLTELLDEIEPELIASASTRSGRDDEDFREEFPEDHDRCKRLRALLAKAGGSR